MSSIIASLLVLFLSSNNLDGTMTGVSVIEQIVQYEEDEPTLVHNRKKQKRNGAGVIKKEKAGSVTENVLDKTKRAVAIKAKNSQGEEEVQRMLC
jgi:hypothetical protein